VSRMTTRRSCWIDHRPARAACAPVARWHARAVAVDVDEYLAAVACMASIVAHQSPPSKGP